MKRHIRVHAILVLLLANTVFSTVVNGQSSQNENNLIKAIAKWNTYNDDFKIIIIESFNNRTEYIQKQITKVLFSKSPGEAGILEKEMNSLLPLNYTNPEIVYSLFKIYQIEKNGIIEGWLDHQIQ